MNSYHYDNKGIFKRLSRYSYRQYSLTFPFVCLIFACKLPHFYEKKKKENK